MGRQACKEVFVCTVFEWFSLLSLHVFFCPCLSFLQLYFPTWGFGPLFSSSLSFWPSSLLLTAMCYWSTTPTHLFCNFLTCGVKKRCLLVESTLPNFPHHLLIIEQVRGVRRSWLYPPPFPSPVEHLFYDEDNFLSCHKKITCILASTCVIDMGKKVSLHILVSSNSAWCLTNCQER